MQCSNYSGCVYFSVLMSLLITIQLPTKGTIPFPKLFPKVPSPKAASKEVKRTTSFTFNNVFSSNFHHRSLLTTLSDPENAKEVVEKYDFVAGGNTVVEY